MVSNTNMSNTPLYIWTLGCAAVISAAAYYYIRRNRKCIPHFPNSIVQLDPESWQKFQLVERLPVTGNSSIFRFKLPSPNDALNLPIGRHLHIRAHVDGTEVVRSYTPITLPDEKGYFELLIKVFFKLICKVYPTGTVSKYIGNMKIGDWLECKGPKGKMTYQPNMVKNLGMIAGGTGITPMLQVIRSILRNPEDKTQVSLIFGNLTEDDILQRQELDELAMKHDNFKVYYVINELKNPNFPWEGSTGLIVPEIISQRLPKPGPDTKILICGPPPMNKAMAANLEFLGYDPLKTPCDPNDMVFKF
jgi:cytochrome-b5 reductase